MDQQTMDSIKTHTEIIIEECSTIQSINSRTFDIFEKLQTQSPNSRKLISNIYAQTNASNNQVTEVIEKYKYNGIIDIGGLEYSIKDLEKQIYTITAFIESAPSLSTNIISDTQEIIDRLTSSKERIINSIKKLHEPDTESKQKKAIETEKEKALKTIKDAERRTLSLIQKEIENIRQAESSAKSYSEENLARIYETRSEIEKNTEQLVSKFVNEVTRSTSRLQEEVSEANESLESKINQSQTDIESFFEKHEKELKRRSTEFSELVGKASHYAIAGEHIEAAKNEKETADKLRSYSIIIMLLIAAVITGSIIESWFISSSFQWETAIQRMLNIFILTVPAAYLARESTKHRQQQYAYHQTALDLKALDPFIGTMPKEEQDSIKKEFANKIFAAKEFSAVVADPYPINAHEILMALVSKMPKGQITQPQPQPQQSATPVQTAAANDQRS